MYYKRLTFKDLYISFHQKFTIFGPLRSCIRYFKNTLTLEHPHPLLLAINTYILQWMSKTKKLIRRNLCLPLSIRNIQISCEKRFSFQNYSLKNKPFYYIHISLTILGNVNGVVTQLRNTILEIYFQFGVKYSLKNKVYPFKKNHCDYFRNSRTICSEYEWRCLVYRH